MLMRERISLSISLSVFFYVSLLPAITVFYNLPHQSDRVSVSIFAWTANQKK